MSNESPKIIKKPWGKEVWLRVPTEEEKKIGRGYCYKRIYINSGERTSYQYHERKMETNYIIKGRAEVWLENERGIVEKIIMGPDEFFTVIPPRKHRVVALTDLILQEASTPEVDDIVRLEDDTGRGDGRINCEHGGLK